MAVGGRIFCPKFPLRAVHVCFLSSAKSLSSGICKMKNRVFAINRILSAVYCSLFYTSYFIQNTSYYRSFLPLAFPGT